MQKNEGLIDIYVKVQLICTQCNLIAQIYKFWWEINFIKNIKHKLYYKNALNAIKRSKYARYI